jgi:hypothetical protein
LANERTIAEQWGRPGEVDAIAAASPGGRWMTEDLRAFWHNMDGYGRRDPARRERIRGVCEFVRRTVRALHEAEARIVLGTDTPLPGMVPGWSLIEEVDAVSDAASDRRAALRAATVDAGAYAADIVHGSERFGRLLPGWSADIVLVDHDPVARPFTCDDLRGVMTSGRWLDVTDLRRLRAEVQATPSLAARATPVDRAALAAHAGVYADAESSLTIELAGAGLVAIDTTGRRMRLAARSPNEFAVLDDLMLSTARFVRDRLVLEVDGDEGGELARCEGPTQPAGCSPPPPVVVRKR